MTRKGQRVIGGILHDGSEHGVCFPTLGRRRKFRSSKIISFKKIILNAKIVVVIFLFFLYFLLCLTAPVTLCVV